MPIRRRATPAPPGQPGEIVIAGPQVMKGYWNKPEADAEVFVAAGLRTGDVGTIDEDGYIRIVDRLKDMIAVSGFKVFPSQLEALLYQHEAVREALVIGIPDPYAGERPKAGTDLDVEVFQQVAADRRGVDLLGNHHRGQLRQPVASAANSSRPISCSPSCKALPAERCRSVTASSPSARMRLMPASRLATMPTGAVWW